VRERMGKGKGKEEKKKQDVHTAGRKDADKREKRRTKS
jgi:hypothetical protein